MVPQLSRLRWLLIVPAFLLVLLALAACEDEEEEATQTPTGEQSPVAAEGPLKIGLLLDFTGALAAFGPEEEDAARLAVKHINDAGGVLGQPVEVVVADSATAPDTGVSEARRLVDVEKVDVIIGSLASGVTVAVAESVTVPAKILQISHASTSPALTDVADNDYLFRTPISDAAQGQVLAKLVADLGYTKVCTMYVNNAYGQGLTEAFAAAYTGEVTAQISHTVETAATYAAELDQCTAGGPEALVAISYPKGQADVYLKEALEGGKVANFVFVDGTKDDEMFTTLGWDKFDGMKGTAPGALPPSEFTQKFDELYVAEYGALYQVPFVREIYDAVIIAALAAEKAGSADSTAIRDALRDVANAPGTLVDPPPEGIAAALEAIRNGEDIDYSGASGSVEFDDNGDVLLGAIEEWRIDGANQKFVTEKVFKVDLAAGTVEELPSATARQFHSSADRFMLIDPVLQRALRTLS